MAATSGRLSGNCGTVVSFFLLAPFRYYDIDRHDHDYDHDEGEHRHDEDNDDHEENGDDLDVRRSSAGGRSSSCPN